MGFLRSSCAARPIEAGGRGTALDRPTAVGWRRPSVAEVIAARRPSEPLECLRPDVLTGIARSFVAAFPGEVLYAVKANPRAAVVGALARGGISHFDVASPAEIKRLRRLCPTAELHYMHPVKSRSAIAAAWRDHGVRDYALDSASELDKILDETGGTGGTAAGRGLMVRLAVPNPTALHGLSGKFGADPRTAIALLRRGRAHATRLGLTFHVGSQCLDPADFETALARVGEVIAAARVAIDVIDVGGGFPVAYADITPPPLSAFWAAIRRGVARLGLAPSVRLWCEPGRALAAPGGSMVLQVVHRRGRALYVNDGVYGSLSDGGREGVRYPVRLHRDPARPAPTAATVPFTLFGPTCDSVDFIPGPFLLPDDVAEGDWIELGQLGAYGTALGARFNGFGAAEQVEVRDPPLDHADPAAGPASVRLAECDAARPAFPLCIPADAESTATGQA